MNKESFVRSVRIVSYKSLNKLKNTTLETYLSNSFLLYVWIESRKPTVWNGHAIVRFIPAFCTQDKVSEKENDDKDDILVFVQAISTIVPLKSVLLVTGDRMRKEKQIRVLHGVIRVVLRPSQECE